MNFDWDNLEKNLNFSASGKSYEKDTRFWKMSRDENDNGTAIIRLLPDTKTTPFIKMYHYSLRKYNANTKKYQWYIENSPEIIGLPDPVKEHYILLSQDGDEAISESAKDFKRQTKFITNIIVIKDPSNPENDGKVFLWEFGTKLKDKFFSWMKPSEDELALGTTPKPLYNPVSSYNIKLKAHRGSNTFVSYENSEVFGELTSIIPGKKVSEEDALKYLADNCYDLNEFLSPEYYKSYNELKAKFEGYLGGVTTPTKSKPKQEENSYTPVTGVGTKETSSAVQKEKATDDEDWLKDLK